MKMQDTTHQLSQASDFASAALFQLAQDQERVVLTASELTEGQQTALSQRLRQLDGIVQSAGQQLTALVTLPGLRLLTEHWATWFPNEAQLQATLDAILASYALDWQAGAHTFHLRDQPMVYGIMNITPDSFYDGGRYQTMDAVLAHVEDMLTAGADVIEVNGQTTRPGYTEITPELEIERTVPYIDAIMKRFPEAVLAIDTYKVPVMQAAIDAGVSIINDVNSFTDDPAKLALMAKSNVGLLTMLNGRQFDFKVMTPEMHQFFEDNLNALTAAGIDRNRIAIDQGLGYADTKVKNDDQDYVIMNNVGKFNDLNRPMMVAVSRKGYMGTLLDIPKDQRLPMTLVSETAMILNGGRIIRVHDVKETRQMVTLLKRVGEGYWLV